MTNQPEDPEALRNEIKRLRKALAASSSSLNSMLRLRGFKIHSSEKPDDLLIPAPPNLDGYFELMKRYSFRLFLRDVIKHKRGFNRKDVTHYATREVTEDYIGRLVKMDIIEKSGGLFRLKGPKVKSFGSTLEWFIAETIKREFCTEAIWGIKFKGQKVGGDYDLIARIDGTLLYMEVKSSPPKQIYDSEISAFLDRVEDLKPAVSIFFMDTELRMKDKIVPMFEEALRKRYAEPPKIMRMEKELFEIPGEIFIINSKDSILANLEKVLYRHFREVR